MCRLITQLFRAKKSESCYFNLKISMLQQQRRRFCSHWVRPESFDYFKNIVESRVYEAAIQTPLGYARSLSEELPGNNTVLLKREDLQPTFSFNLRGAYNKLANLSHHQKKNGSGGIFSFKIQS